jgi:hypothetical protein
MAAKSAALSVNIIADASKAKAAFKQAEDAAGSMTKQMQTVGKTIATAFVTDKFVDFAKGSIKAASDLDESINAVNVTFGKASGGILKFGETASKTVGMSKAQFNSFAVTFSGFTQLIAGSTGDITKVTTELTKRIADFASVMNLDIKEAAQVFQSSLAGETEPIRKFGIDMSAAAVQLYALENGLVSSAAEMTEGIKVQARYGLLMESTAKTAGDFANTSDSLANQQRILAAEFENVKVKIGEALIPSLQSVLGAIGPVFDAFNSLPGSMQQTVVQMGFMLGATSLLKTNLENFGLASSKADLAIKSLRFGFAGLIIADGIGNLLNEVSDASGNLDRKLQALQISLGDVGSAANNSTDPLLAFRDLVAAEGKTFNLANIFRDVGKEITIVGGSIGRDIEYIDIAFDKLAGSSTEMAQKLLNSWATQNAALDRNSQQYKDNQMLIERYQDRLDLTTASNEAMSNTLNNATSNSQRLAKATDVLTGSLGKAGDGTKKLDEAWKVTRNTFDDGRFVSKALVDVWREGYSQLIAAGDASEDLTNAWREGYGELVEAGTVSEDLVDAWVEGYSALIKGKESSDFLINAWREGYKALREADSVSVDLKNSWLEGYRAMINGRKASDELTVSVEKMGAQARNTSNFVDGLGKEWDYFLGLLDKRDAFANAKTAVKDYEETFKKALNGNKEAQQQLNDKLVEGQRQIARARELADLIPVNQDKQIRFLTQTGQLDEALALLKEVDGWYRTVQSRAAVTPSGMGSGRPPAGPAPAAPAPAPAPPSMTTPRLTPRQADLLSRFKGLALGGTLTSSGLVMVGENGPELLGLPRGASVTPNIPQRLNDMAGGGTVINITVQAGLVSSPDQVGQQIIEAIKRAERRSGQVFASV